MNPGPVTVPGPPGRWSRRRASAAGGRARARHEGGWRGSTLTFRLAGVAAVTGAAALAVVVTGWTPGSIGMLAGAVTVFAAALRGALAG